MWPRLLTERGTLILRNSRLAHYPIPIPLKKVPYEVGYPWDRRRRYAGNPMVKSLAIRWLMPVCLVPLLLSCGCSSSLKSTSGVMEDPIPTQLTWASVPILDTEIQNPFQPWIMTVDQQVQIRAIDSMSGKQVNDQLNWALSPWKFANDPVGTLDQSGHYTAPSSPSGVVISAGAIRPVAYQGAKYITIVAAPHITAFSATPLTIMAGQSSSLMASFENGQGQILIGNQVIQADLTSGTPVTVSPTATTVYTLQVTNAAGARVRQDWTVLVQ